MLKQSPSSINAQAPIYSLSHIEQLYDYDTFLYILRRLSRIIKTSFHKQESKDRLKRRIKRFDKDCGLDGLLANIPIDYLLDELGDAELIYRV